LKQVKAFRLMTLGRFSIPLVLLASLTFQSLNQLPAAMAKMELLCKKIAEITNKHARQSDSTRSTACQSRTEPPVRGWVKNS
jgi:hypothetical protein